MAEGAGSIGPGDEAVRALAAEILGREEYAAYRGDLAAWQAFFDWLANFSDWIEALRASSPALFWLLMGAMLLVAGLLLAHVVFTLRAALQAPGPPEDLGGGGRRGADWLGQARARAAAGHYVDAARLVQLATLDRLLESGIIDLARHEPNQILRRRLAEARLPASERADLLEALDRLEAALFRERREEAALYESWLSLHGRLARLPVRVRA